MTSAPAALELDGEVVRGDAQPFVEVQPVRVMAGITRVEMQRLTTLRSSVSEQPVHQRTGVATTASLGDGRQIIDVQNPAPGEEFAEAESRGARDSASGAECENLVTLLLLAPDLRKELLDAHMRPKGAERVKARRDLGV